MNFFINHSCLNDNWENKTSVRNEKYWENILNRIISNIPPKVKSTFIKSDVRALPQKETNTLELMDKRIQDLEVTVIRLIDILSLRK